MKRGGFGLVQILTIGMCPSVYRRRGETGVNGRIIPAYFRIEKIPRRLQDLLLLGRGRPAKGMVRERHRYEHNGRY
jgi:hypothetical protein